MNAADWKSLVDEHLRWLLARDYAATTARGRRRPLQAFVAWGVANGLTEPRSYAIGDIERYRIHIHGLKRKDGLVLGSGSRSQRLLAIKGFFRWLTLIGVIPSNPAADVALPRRPHRLPREVLSIAEIERVLSQPDLSRAEGLRDRAIMELLYSTGLRRTECATVTLRDLDTERGIMLVRRGKGGRDRYVPVGRRAVAWVARYVGTIRTRQAPRPDPGHLFLSRRRSAISPKRVGGLVRRHLLAAGIDRPGACHLFRHTAATHLLEGGADIRYIQEILGHAQLSTTALYASVSIHRLQEVHRRCHPTA